MTKKRIKNRAVRRILRQIANWDTCPKDYRRNFTREAETLSLCTLGAGIAIGIFFTFLITFC